MLSLIERKGFQVFQLEIMWIFMANLRMFEVFLEILVYNSILNKYEMYKKVFTGALKL